MTDHDDAQAHHGPGEFCAAEAGDPPAAGGPDPGRAAVLLTIEQECEQWLQSRDPLPVAERARTAFMRDKATALARVTGADPWPVAAAALIDGLAVTFHGDSTQDAPRRAPRDGGGDGPAGDAAAGLEIWDDDATPWAARAIRSVLRTVPDRRERARIVEILRGARRHPGDGTEVPAGVSAEARALHDARTVFTVLPFGPILLSGALAQLQAWNTARATASSELAATTELTFTYTPAGRPPLVDAGTAIQVRRHGTLAVHWPPEPEQAGPRDSEAAP